MREVGYIFAAYLSPQMGFIVSLDFVYSHEFIAYGVYGESD